MEMTFRTEKCGDTVLCFCIHTAATPALDEWAAFEASLRKVRSAGELDLLRVLVVSDGGAPNTHQRHVVQNEIYQGRSVKTALLTNSLANPIKRGIARAITWMNEGFKVCVPHDLRGALVHLGLANELEQVWRTARDLQARLPPVATLGEIADALKRPRLAGSSLERAG
jgi:hypothetical protein